MVTYFLQTAQNVLHQFVNQSFMFTNKTYTNDDKTCRMGILSVLLTPKSQMRLGGRGAWVGTTAVAPRGVRTPDWPTQPVTQPRKDELC